MAGICAAGRIVRAGRVYAKGLNPFLNQAHGCGFIEARILADILLCAVKPVECAGVEKKDVALAHIKTSFRNNSVQVTSTNRGAWFGMRDINARGITIEEVEGHRVYGWGFGARIEVA